QQLMCTSQTRLNIFAGDVVVFLQHIVNAPPLRQKADDELDGHARAPDDRLARQHVGIHRDAVVHKSPLISGNSVEDTPASASNSRSRWACKTFKAKPAAPAGTS